MKSGKNIHTKRQILAILTLGLIMTFASSVLAEPMTQYQGQNQQEGHKEGHEGHQGHHKYMRHQQSTMDTSALDNSAT